MQSTWPVIRLCMHVCALRVFYDICWPDILKHFARKVDWWYLLSVIYCKEISFSNYVAFYYLLPFFKNSHLITITNFISCLIGSAISYPIEPLYELSIRQKNALWNICRRFNPTSWNIKRLSGYLPWHSFPPILLPTSKIVAPVSEILSDY